MRTIIIWFLLLTLVLTVTGCGAREKLEEKAGQALTEKIIEKATGSELDIKDDNITIKDDQGQEVTFGTGQWPKSDLAKNISEFKKGTITSVIDSADYILITMGEVNKDDFIQYLQTIKGDFTQDSFEATSEDVTTYMGSNGKGVGIQISYALENESISIGIIKVE